MVTEHLLVSIVDDDESVRESLLDLLKALGYGALAFSSAEAFLSSNSVDRSSCLVLDVSMPGMTGLDLQQHLARRSRSIPIIFITACRDNGLRQYLIERGAVECLFKPFSDTSLQEALNHALPAS